MKAFFEKHLFPSLDERKAFEMMEEQLEKAEEDFDSKGDYCEHVKKLMIMCQDFLEVKGELTASNIPTVLRPPHQLG